MRRLATPVDRLFEAHLVVSDLSRSLAFYHDDLGLEVAYHRQTRRVAFVWIGAPGGSMLGLWAGGAAPQKTTSHVAFGTALANVIAAPKALASAGIRALDFEERPTDEPVVLAWMPAAAVYFHDPDGHLLEYIAMLAEPPRLDLGVVTWREWRGEI